MTVLPFPEQQPETPPAAGPPVPREDPNRPGTVAARLARTGSVPSRVQIARRARWMVREGLPQLGVTLLKAPWLALCETPYVWIGLCRFRDIWADWMAVSEMAVPKGTEQTAAHIRTRAEKRSSRRKITFWLCVLAGVAIWWCVVKRPAALAVAAFVLWLVFDALGHRQRPRENAPPPPHRAVWKEGASSASRIRTLIEIGLREGLELGVIGAITYDPVRQESRLTVTCLDRITPEHCRAFERGLGVADRAIRIIAPEDEEATVRILVIKEGDPLAFAEMPFPPPVVVGSGSIEEGVLVGAGMVRDLVLPIAGQHGTYMAASGGGKSSWMLRNTMIGLLPKRDVRPIIIDPTDGPERALWARVCYRTASEPARIEALLDEILAEKARRARVLAAIQEDDDPTNDHIIEWISQLGDYWVILFDEYPALAPAAKAKAEEIFRTGRKHGICAQVFIQKFGNDDTGSSVPVSQSNILVGGPCTARDAANLFGSAEKRDAGWMPHLLKAGTQDNPHDAGKVYIETPWHHAPDLYRYFRPISPGQVKQLCRRVLAEGWGASWETVVEPEDAVVVDPLLAEVDRAFGDSERISTADLLAHLAAADPQTWGGLTSIRLADLLRGHSIRPRGLVMPDGTQLRGYQRSEVRAAIQRETES